MAGGGASTKFLMEKSVSAETQPSLHPSIPRVLCPRCGTQMRLAKAETAARDGDKLMFECTCGFEYQMNAAPKHNGTL